MLHHGDSDAGQQAQDQAGCGEQCQGQHQQQRLPDVGGHIVQGHVDQTATCVEIKDAEGSWYFTFKYAFDKEMAKRGYITVDKGSVTVNGVSLTVCNPTDDTFQVAIIPYTYEYTNFHTFEIGSVVNIEFDIIGKYISRMIQYR